MTPARTRDRAERILIAHPSADLYGSDLQLVEAVIALRRAGSAVRVVLPVRGPLIERLEDAGARCRVVPFPVLRQSVLTRRGLPPFAASLGPSTSSLVGLLRWARPDRLVVNTLTIPWWVAAGRLAGVRTIVYSHEAEAQRGRAVSTALTAPLLAAHRVVANSRATAQVLTGAIPALRAATVVVPNGVPDPGEPAPARRRSPGDPLRTVVVGRLSPRKGTMIALEAVALLRRRVDVRLDVVGSVFTGYEWFEARLRERADQADLAGAVTFHGYVNPTRALLEAADVVLVPSFGESFGNVAVEGMLAARPVVACEGLGLGEVLRNAPRTGLLVPVGDPREMAGAVGALADDPERCRAMGLAARTEALARFSMAGYRRALARAVITA